jgi:L-lactate dehydrogenase complex protein LldE
VTTGPARASLFVTCLVDQFQPEVGEATVAVLRRLGVALDFPPDQTCCGLPLYNNGYRAEAQAIARRTIPLFAHADAIVVPSGSCAWMLRVAFPTLFPGEPRMTEAARTFAAKAFEFSDYIVNRLRVRRIPSRCAGRATYHASCHLMRGLGVSEPPRLLLRGVEGLELVEMDRAEVCCGFGGSFAVKLPAVSGAIMDEKLASIDRTGATLVAANDAGCIIHLAGGAHRRGRGVRVVHLAEILAGTA